MFKLQFPISQIQKWSDSYSYNKDSLEEKIIKAISPRVRKNGYLDKTDFLLVCQWKTERSKSRCAKNTPEDIKEITSIALKTTNERVRIELLTLLDGVAFPTASVFLHFFHPDKYPILDFRALYSLGVDPPPSQYTFAFWNEYVQQCRHLSNKSGLDMRAIDRALWAYSSENQ